MATEAELTAARHEVQRRFGQCLLRLQGYEMLMKSIVAAHDISAPAAKFEVAQADRVAEARGKTLGMLVGEMMGSFLVAAGKEGIGSSREDAPSVSFRMQLILSDEELIRTQTDLRDLVKLRNDLVHHFLEQHELVTQEGCLEAQSALALILDRITQAYGELRSCAEDFEQTRKLTVEYLASPEFQDFVIDGRVPWSLTEIAEALKEAARELATEGWAPVDAAVQWVNEKYPDEQPDVYGCASWRQVIQETRLFDLRYRLSNGSRQAWYRLRAWDTTSP